MENKKANKIKLSINMDDLDKAQEKANKLKDTLLEVKQLINSVNSKEDVRPIECLQHDIDRLIREFGKLSLKVEKISRNIK